MDALEEAKRAAERYDNQIDADKYDHLTEQRRYYQAKMYAQIAQAEMLERIAKSLREMNVRDWKRSE